MRKAGLLMSIAVAATVLVGCGGGGGGSNSQRTTRTVAGFVYVKGTGGGTPEVAVLPTAQPPAGYFAATGGTIRLSVADGTISRAPDQEDFLMSSSNAIVATVEGPVNSNVTVSALGTITGTDGTNNLSGTMSTFNGNLGVKASEGTVLTLNNGSATYTPGAPASIRYTIDGVVPTEPTVDFIAGAPAKSLAIVALDASKVIVPGTTFNVVSNGTAAASVDVTGSGNAFTLTGGTPPDVEGALTIDIDAVGANLQSSINATFDYGTASAITVTSSAASVTWGTTAPVVANTTATLTATVTNGFGIAMPGETVTFTNPKAPGNTWAAAPGTNITAISGVSDANGVVTATFNPPDAIGVPPAQTGSAAKGTSTVTATVGSATDTVDIEVLRPIGALVIAGPTRLDVGTTSTAGAFSITGATDVDGDTAAIPVGVATWALTNQQFSANVGNTGDVTVGTTAASSINAGTGVVTAGNAAGQIEVTATIGAVTSNPLTVQVVGIPSKIVFVPDTAASVIPSARGEYVFGSVGATQQFDVTLQDSAGHVVINSEVTGFSTTATIQALTGGSITPGGAGVDTFTITSGNVDGLFTIVVTGNWTGAAGGSGPINLSRDTGQNAP